MVNPLFAGISRFRNSNILGVQKLLGFFAGGSAFAHVGPVNCHLCSPFHLQ